MFPKCSRIKHLVKRPQGWRLDKPTECHTLANDVVDIRDGMTLDLCHCLDAFQYLNQLMPKSVGNIG